MKKTKKKMNTFIATVCMTFILGSVTAFASSLMTYNGSGIRGKYSIGTFSINSNDSTFYVDHSQSWNYGGTQVMDITAYKQNWAGSYSSNQGTETASGDGSFTLTFSEKPSGVYKLYFGAEGSYNAADISGEVYN